MTRVLNAAAVTCTAAGIMDDLIARLEAAEGPDRELDGDIAIMMRPGFYPNRDIAQKDAPRYSSSIDAALTLVPEGYGRLDIMIIENGHTYVSRDVGSEYDAEGKIPPLAICIAALKARAQTARILSGRSTSG